MAANVWLRRGFPAWCALGSVSLAALFSTPAAAQRTAENATVQSSDAFGTQIGSERTGLYSRNDVRGFDPVDLGNARIEGLYFDQIDRLPRALTDRSTIRVGISAQGFVFPAPTGLVDYKLISPGESPRLSLDFDTGTYFAPGLTLDFEMPLAADRFGIAGGFGVRNFASPDGRRNRFRNGALLASWQPYMGAEVHAFAGGVSRTDDEARPTFYVDGDYLPPQISRGIDLSQPWSDRDNYTTTLGTIARLPVGAMTIQAGVFYDSSTDETRFSDLMLGTAQDGSVRDRVIIADGDLLDRSLSGEVRAMRSWRSSSLVHTLTLSLRGRHKQRRFGSSTRLSLGASTLLTPDLREEPTYTLRTANHDDVRQWTYGLAYNLASRGGLNFGFGLSQAQYRKQTNFADPMADDLSAESSPVIWDVSASYAVNSWLTVFGGLSRGLEEALIAPETALNRSEAPPAILSRQEEAGLRVSIVPGVTLVAGVFRISKPYYNLDTDRLYRQLGSISVKGAEFSIVGQLAPGVSILAGTVLLDPVITGEVVASGLIGPHPVGQVRRRSILNLDWRPAAGASSWSFDLAVESFSSRYANAANTLSAPGHTSFDLGLRYRFALGKAEMLLRLKVENLFNEYAWQVTSSGGFTYINGRTATVQLIADI